MTLVLVVACLAIAGAELYLVFGRNRRDASTLSDLDERNTALETRLAEALTRLDALAADLSTRPDTAALTRLTRKIDATMDDLATRLDGARRTQEEFAERHDTTVDDLRRTENALASRLDATAYDLRHVEDTLGTALTALSRTASALAARVDESLAELDRNDTKQAERLIQLDQNDARLAGRLHRVERDGAATAARLEELADAAVPAGMEQERAELTERIEGLRTGQEELAERLGALHDARSEVALRLEDLTRREEELAGRVEALERSSHEAVLGDLSRRLDLLDDLAANEAQRAELLALRTQTDQALERLEELDAERDRDLERYRDLAQALDSVEDLLAGQRADAEPTTVRGGLSGDLPDTHEILTKTYDDFVDTMDLRVRMQVPSGSAPWQTQYYLAGKNPARLRRDFASLLGSLHTGAPDPRLESLHRLATAMTGTDQAYAQIGPLALIRLGDTLLCGVLTVAENRRFDVDRFLSDPSATASRLRLLPDTRFRDLSTWLQTA